MEKDQLDKQISDLVETSPAEQKKIIEVVPALDLSDTELPDSDTQPAPYYGGSVIKDLPTSTTQRAADGSEGNPVYYNDENRFIPVDPYKIVLPAMQREVTINTMDPKKAAFNLATEKLGIDRNEFIGYEHVDPEMIFSHIDAAKILSSVYQGNLRSKMYMSKDDIIEIENEEMRRELNDPNKNKALDWDTIGKGLSEGGDFLLKSLYSTLGYGAKGIGNVATALQVLYESADDSVQLANKTFIGELARNWKRAFETTEKNSLGKNIPSRIEDGYIGNKIWNIASQTVDSVNLSTSLNDEANQLTDPTFTAKVVNGIATSLPLMPMFLVNPAIASTVVGAGVSDNITRNLLDQGYTFGEANARGLLGGGIVGTSAFLSWKVSELVMDAALRALGKGVFGTAVGATAVSAVEGITETFEERVERSLAEAGNPIKNFFGPLSEDDVVAFLAAAATSMFTESPKIRLAYKNRELVKTLTDEEKKEFNRLVSVADAYKDTLVTIGLGEKQAKDAMIKLVSEGPEFIDSFVKNLFSGAKDRANSGEFKEQTSALLDKLNPKNIEDAVKTELETLRIRAEEKYSDKSAGLSDLEQKLMVATVLNRALQNAALTGESVLDYKLPEVSSINRGKSSNRGTHTIRYKETKNGREYLPSRIEINKALSGPYESEFDTFSSKEKFLDFIWTLVHENFHEDFYQNALNMDADTWRGYTKSLIEYLEKTFDKRKPGDDASKAIELLSSDPEVARDTTLNGTKSIASYTDPTSSTEFLAQAVTRLGPEAKKMFGLDSTNQAWQMVAAVERALAIMNNAAPLTTGLQNFVEEFNKFVKANSEKIKKLVGKKGTRQLNSAIKALMSGNKDTLNWKGITYDDLMEFAKLTGLPLDAEAIEGVRRSLEGVKETDWFKFVDDLWNEATAAEEPAKTPKTVDDIDEIDLDELFSDTVGITNEERQIGYQASATAQYDQPALVDKYGNSLIGSGEGSEAHMRGSYFLKNKERDKFAYFFYQGLAKKSLPLEVTLFLNENEDGDWENEIKLSGKHVDLVFGDGIYKALLNSGAASNFANEVTKDAWPRSAKDYPDEILSNFFAKALEKNPELKAGPDDSFGFFEGFDKKYTAEDISRVSIRPYKYGKSGQIMEALLPDQDLMFEERALISQQNKPVKKAVLDIANELFLDKDGLFSDEAGSVLEYYGITEIENINRITAKQFWNLLENYYIEMGEEDPGESAREILVKHGIEGNHYFGGSDGEGWVVFDTGKIEPQRVARGIQEVINFEQVASDYARNNLMAQIETKEEPEETAFQKRINKTVDGRTLEEDFDYFEKIFLKTRTKRGIDAWFSERRGLDGYLFSLGGMDALRATQLPLKRQAFRDIYDSSMSMFRERAKRELFNGSDLKYDVFLKDYLADTIDAEIYNDITGETKTEKVSPSKIAYALLAYDQTKANGPLRTLKTWKNLKDVAKLLTPTQLRFSKMLREDLKTVLSTELKSQNKYNDKVGYVLENYYPLVTQKAVTDDRPSTTLSFLSRKETESPIGVISDLEVYGRYMGRIAGGRSKYFQEVQRLSDLLDFKPSESLNDEDFEKAKELESRSRKFRNLIINKIGVNGLSNIEDYIRELKGGSAVRELSNTALYKVSKSLTPSLLGGKLKNFFANIWNSALVFGAPDIEDYWEFMGELTKATAHQAEAFKETMKIGSIKTGKKDTNGKFVPGLGFFANRFANTNITEFTQRGANPTSDKILNDFAKFLQKKNLSSASDVAEVMAWLATKADKLVMLPTTLGDLAGNFVTAAALRRQYIKQNIRKGMSSEDAIVAADDAVIDFVLHRQSSSNQALKPLSVLRWNKQNSFMASAAQFTGETTTKVGQIGMDIQGARMGEISAAQAARDILSILVSQIGYLLTQSGGFGLLVSLAIGDIDDDEREFVYDNLAMNAVQMLSDFVSGPVSGWTTPLVLGAIYGRYGASTHPLLSEFAKLEDAIEEIIKSSISGDEIETNDIVTAIGKGAAYGAGFPAIDTIVDSIRGAYDAAFGETETERKKGRYMATGRSESFAKKAAGAK